MRYNKIILCVSIQPKLLGNISISHIAACLYICFFPRITFYFQIYCIIDASSLRKMSALHTQYIENYYQTNSIIHCRLHTHTHDRDRDYSTVKIVQIPSKWLLFLMSILLHIIFRDLASNYMQRKGMIRTWTSTSLS